VETKVKCMICGVEREHLVSHVNSEHRLNKSQYIALFPTAKVCSELFSQKKRDTQLGREYGTETSLQHKKAWKEGRYEGSFKNRIPPRKGTTTSEQARRNMRVGAIGKVPSDEHKKNIGLGVKESLKDLTRRSKRVDQLLKMAKNYPYKCGCTNILNRDVYYRSSYELTGLKLLESNKESIVGFESETLKIPYTALNGETKITVPDWLITLQDGTRYLIEVKPEGKLADSNTIVKLQSAEGWAKGNGVTYCVWTEKFLYNPSSTTMSLEEILKATATDQTGRRYSLNSSVMKRE